MGRRGGEGGGRKVEERGTEGRADKAEGGMREVCEPRQNGCDIARGTVGTAFDSALHFHHRDIGKF